MSKITAEASTVVAAPRERVWQALTDPELIAQYYMGAEVITDWHVGHPIVFKGEFNGKRFEDKGEILTFIPTQQMSYSHWSPLSGTADDVANYHVVHIELADADQGSTRVTLRQSNLNGEVTEADRASRTDYEKNWSGMLDGLKRVAEGASVDGSR
jgi:uncharacterized protein YndB with AHSA1/START domain